MPEPIKIRLRESFSDLEEPGDWCFIKSLKIGIWLYCVCGITNPISGRTITINPDGELSVLEKLMCPACLAQIEIHKNKMKVTHSKEGNLYSKSLAKEVS